MKKLSMIALGIGALALGALAVSKLINKSSDSKKYDDSDFDDYDFEPCDCCKEELDVVIPAEEAEEISDIPVDMPSDEELAEGKTPVEPEIAVDSDEKTVE